MHLYIFLFTYFVFVVTNAIVFYNYNSSVGIQKSKNYESDDQMISL